MEMANDLRVQVSTDLRSMTEDPISSRMEAFAMWKASERDADHEEARASAQLALERLNESDASSKCWQAFFRAQECSSVRMKVAGLAGAQKMIAYGVLDASVFRKMRDALPVLAHAEDSQVRLRTLQVALTLLQVEERLMESASFVSMEVAMRLRSSAGKDTAVRGASDATVRQAVACALEDMSSWERVKNTKEETRMKQEGIRGEELVKELLQDLLRMSKRGHPMHLNAPGIPRGQALDLLDMALRTHASTLASSPSILENLLREGLVPMLHRLLLQAADPDHGLEPMERDTFSAIGVRCAATLVLQLHEIMEDEADLLMSDILALREKPIFEAGSMHVSRAQAAALASLRRSVSNVSYIRSLYLRKRGMLGEHNFLQQTIAVASQVTRVALQPEGNRQPCSLGDVATHFVRPNPSHEDEADLEEPSAHATHEASLAVLLFLDLASTADHLAEEAVSTTESQRTSQMVWNPMLARQLISDLWGSLLPELSRWLSRCKEPDHSTHAIETMFVALLRALQQVAQAASAAEASAARDGALATLGAYALPRSEGEATGIDQLQAQALRTLFNTIHCLHRGLGAAWKIVLLPLLELDAAVEQAGLNTDTEVHLSRRGTLSRTSSNSMQMSSMGTLSNGSKSLRGGLSAAVDFADLSVLAAASSQLFAATAHWDARDAKDAVEALAALSHAGFGGALQRMVDIALAQLHETGDFNQVDQGEHDTFEFQNKQWNRRDGLWCSCSYYLLQDAMQSDSQAMRQAAVDALARMAMFALSTDSNGSFICGVSRAEAAVQLWCDCMKKYGNYSDVANEAWERLRRSSAQYSEALARAWKALLPLLSSAAEEGVCITAAFDVTQRLVEDELHILPWEAHAVLADTLHCFCTQHGDLNAALTAVRLLWNVIDTHVRLLEQQGSSHDASEALSLRAFAALGACIVDGRPEMRLGALRTLVAALGGRAAKCLSPSARCAALAHALLPRLSQLQAIRDSSCQALLRRSISSNSGQARAQGQGNTKLLLVHHSRDTAWKAWDETLCEAVTGAARTALLLARMLADQPETSPTPLAWFQSRSARFNQEDMESALALQDKQNDIDVESASRAAEKAAESLRSGEGPSRYIAWQDTCKAMAHYAYDVSDSVALAAIHGLQSFCDTAVDDFTRKSACETLAHVAKRGSMPSAKARKALGVALQHARHSLNCSPAEDKTDARLLQALRHVASDSTDAWTDALKGVPPPCGEEAASSLLQEACHLLRDQTVGLDLIAETSSALFSWTKTLQQAGLAADALSASCQRGSPEAFDALSKLCTERACAGVAQAVVRVFAVEHSSSTYYSPLQTMEDEDGDAGKDSHALQNSKLALVNALYAATKLCRDHGERTRSAAFALALDSIASCKHARLRECALDALQALCDSDGAPEEALPYWLNRCRLQTLAKSSQKRMTALQRLEKLQVPKQAVRDASKALVNGAGLEQDRIDAMLLQLEGENGLEELGQEHLLFVYDALCKAASLNSHGSDTQASGLEEDVRLLALKLLMRIGKSLGLMGHLGT